MAQNIYDKQEFFEEYGKLPRSVHGLKGAPEWSTLRHLVGNVDGLSVLDLGCGMGWFCRWARAAGAKHVHGVDVSTKMLDRARSLDNEVPTRANCEPIEYDCLDLETITLEPSMYDIVYSSLTLHYLPSVGSLFTSVFQSLRPNGSFVFSVEHPVMTAPSSPKYGRDEQGRVFWPLNRYIDEGLRETDWLGAEGVRKYHLTVETYVNTLIGCGFTLTALRESWDGMERSTKQDQEDWGGHKPFFLIIAARK